MPSLNTLHTIIMYLYFFIISSHYILNYIFYVQETFYEAPDSSFDDITWFSNRGSTSSDKNILLNLTQYLNDFTEQQLRGKCCLLSAAAWGADSECNVK